MMRFIVLLLCVTTASYAQTTFKETLFLGAYEEKTYEVPGADGDAIEIELEKQSGGNLDMDVTIYPNHRFFSEKDFKKIRRIITVTTRGVYVIKLINPTDKEARFSVSIFSKNFTGNPVTLTHKLVRDTTYAYRVPKNKIIETTKAQPVQTDRFYVNSRSNAFIKGGKNRVLVPITLPENTTEWYYVFTASRNEEEVKGTLNSFNLAQVLSGYIKEDKNLQQAVGNLTTVPGANICDMYLLNEANAKLFTEKEDFEYTIDASRENYKSGVVHVKEVTTPKVYLGLSNPDNLHGIHIAIEVVAIVKMAEKVTQMGNIPVITSKMVPIVIDLED